MKTVKILMSLGILAIFAGCAPSKFGVDSDCNSNASGSCINGNGSSSYSDSFIVAGGKVDLLIVNDNSASMSTEQKLLANRFGNLISAMDSRKIDYRIAMTTTDITTATNPARTINQNGALQDGRLISFAGGKKFISSTEGTAQTRASTFAQAVQRPETLTCENFITTWYASGQSINSNEYISKYTLACPSTDERGIYAARMSLDANESGFLRKDADLAIIFLADEDVRSQQYYYGVPGFELEDKDKGIKLAEHIKTQYPQKKFGLHSIIVTNPTCLAQQGQQLGGAVKGTYGTEYANASNAPQTLRGIIGDICSPDYSSIMNEIYKDISGKIVDKIALGCTNPSDLQVTNSAGIAGRVTGFAYVFDTKLPVGTQVSYSYTCRGSAH